MSASVKHSSETSEQFTPVRIIEMCRKVLGTIDLDPASCELANTRVKAKSIFTAKDGEGLATFEQKWHGNVFMNPPGGQGVVMSGSGYRSNPALFWAKLMHAWHVEQTVNAAIVLGFTMEVLQSSQSVVEYPMLRFPLCIPSKRIAFDVPREDKISQLHARVAKAKTNKAKGLLLNKIAELESFEGEIVSGDDPPHGNVLILVPPREEHFHGLDARNRPWVAWGGEEGEYTQRFQDVFSELGYVRI